jgi:hypothetical protein
VAAQLAVARQGPGVHTAAARFLAHRHHPTEPVASATCTQRHESTTQHTKLALYMTIFISQNCEEISKPGKPPNLFNMACRLVCAAYLTLIASFVCKGTTLFSARLKVWG